jgi:hypothetical protein
MGARGSFSGVKKLGHEADHSSPCSTKVKNAWSYTFSLPYIFMAWWLIKQGIRLHRMELVKHRDNFTFTVKSNQ